jgi:hypothetical protein
MALLEGGGIYEGYCRDAEDIGCFYCSKVRDDEGCAPMIAWFGGPTKNGKITTLYLHRGCALALCRGLIRDVEELPSGNLTL